MMLTRHDPTKSLVTLQQPIERPKVFQIVDAKWPPLAVTNELSEPVSKRARLGGNAVEFSRHRLGSQRLERFRRHKLRLLQPSQKSLAILDPVDLSVGRCGN